MKDKVTRERLQQLHPAVRERFEAFIDEVETTLNVTIRMEPPLRTFAEQQALWEQGRTKPGKVVTWAPPGSSYHNYGLAADLVPWKMDHTDLDWNYDFKKWKPLADEYQLVWGGDFSKNKYDPDHFQYTAGLSWQDLLHKHDMKDFIPGTEYVNL